MSTRISILSTFYAFYSLKTPFAIDNMQAPIPKNVFFYNMLFFPTLLLTLRELVIYCDGAAVSNLF